MIISPELKNKKVNTMEKNDGIPNEIKEKYSGVKKIAPEKISEECNTNGCLNHIRQDTIDIEKNQFFIAFPKDDKKTEVLIQFNEEDSIITVIASHPYSTSKNFFSGYLILKYK